MYGIDAHALLGEAVDASPLPDVFVEPAVKLTHEGVAQQLSEGQLARYDRSREFETHFVADRLLRVVDVGPCGVDPEESTGI